MLRAEAQDRQRQARPRCSGCPRCAASGTGVPRTAATASLVEVLAMLPVTPTTNGSNRRRQPAAIAPSAASGVGDPDDRDVAERGPGRRSAARRRARPLPGRSRRPGRRGHRSAHRAGRRTPARRRPAGNRRRPADRVARTGRESRPPVRRDQVVGREGGRRVQPGSRGRRVDVGHGASVAQGALTGPASGLGTIGRSAQQVRRRDRVGRDPPEQLEGHRPASRAGRPARRSASPPRSGSRRRGPGCPSGERCSRRTSS